ncbi:uncharacterized protein LOC126835339 [Adelges cooleyi]|uniref:uncharacterized protein LOC126835339 n=1 Tax=Adelges cooleyi TaxID=133065 RepID=UPI00217F4A25|nr:uncharacterized protein LOC126835339 [Adelges cooleyi]
MKLLFVLISFALVGHVLVAELEEYIEQVTLTNDDIKQAKEFMPTIIKNMIVRPDVYGIEAMVMMLAMPEKLECVLQKPKFIYEIPKPGSSVNRDPGQKIMYFKDKLEFQKMMQSAISAVKTSSLDPYLDPNQAPNLAPSLDPNQNLDPPTVLLRALNLDPNQNPNLASSSDPNQNLGLSTVLPRERIDAPTKFKKENLAGLLIERRIQPIGTHRIIRSLALTSLGSARRVMTLEAITTVLRQDDPHFQNLEMMCRLAGVFRSIKYSTYIYNIEMVNGYCFIIDETFSGGHVYTFFENEFWKVDTETWSRATRFSSEYQ